MTDDKIDPLDDIPATRPDPSSELIALRLINAHTNHEIGEYWDAQSDMSGPDEPGSGWRVALVLTAVVTHLVNDYIDSNGQDRFDEWLQKRIESLAGEAQP